MELFAVELAVVKEEKGLERAGWILKPLNVFAVAGAPC